MTNDKTAAAFPWPVLLVISLLVANTISGSEETLLVSGSADPIMSQKAFLVLKGFGRGLSLLIVVYFLYKEILNVRLYLAFRLLLPFLAFSTLAVFSTVWSPLPSTTLLQAATFMVLILLAWVIASRWKTEGDTSRLLFFSSLVLVGVSTALIFLHFAFPRYGALTKAAAGVFHATGAGSSAALGIMIVTSAAVLWDWRWPRWMLIPCLAIHMACMMIGGNRFSFVATAVGLAFVFCFAASRLMLAIMIFTSCFAGMLYMLFDPGFRQIDLVTSQFAETVQQGQTVSQLQSFSGRIEMWTAIWESIQDSPLLGHGFFVTSTTGEIYVWDIFANWTAHNVWLQCLASTGCIGTSLLIGGFLFLALNLFAPLAAVGGTHWRHTVFALGVGAWYGVWGLLNEAFLGPLMPESVVFAITLGLAAGTAIDFFQSTELPRSVPGWKTGREWSVES